jgi:hypothetical protein
VAIAKFSGAVVGYPHIIALISKDEAEALAGRINDPYIASLRNYAAIYK